VTPASGTTPTIDASAPPALSTSNGGSPAVDVAPHALAACTSSGITLKPDPAMMNRRGLRPGQHNFGMGFMWRMSFAAGAGGCSGSMSFGSPQALAGSAVVPRGELKLNLTRITFNCASRCTKSMSGRLQIKMLSHKQLKMLFGRTLSYKVLTTYQGVTSIHTVRVLVDKHGMLRRAH
jgi:hypothetical protein